jgi:hypothetical protein
VSDTRRLSDVLGPAAGSRFPHRARALLGLYGPEGVSHDDFTRGLTEWFAARTSGAGVATHRTRLGVRIEGTDGLLQESIGASVHEYVAPLDGFVTIDVEESAPTSSDLDALVESLGGLADELGHVVDRVRSFAMAGLVNLVEAGEGPLAMMLMCAHHPEVDLVDTHAWWCSFGEFVHQAGAGPTLGYHQLQCDPALSGRAAARAGLSTTSFDLGDLVYLDRVDEFVARARQYAGSTVDPGPPANQRDDFITFRGSVGAFCSMVVP